MRNDLVRRAAVAAGLALAAGGPVAAQQADPRGLIQAALATVGGEAVARDVRAVTGQAALVTFAIGQERTPDGPAPMSSRMMSFANDWATGQLAQRLDGRSAGNSFMFRQMLVTEGGAFEFQGVVQPAGVTGTLALQRLLHAAPHRLLLEALAPGASLAPAGTQERDGRRLIGVRARMAADTTTFWFDPTTHRLAAVETLIDDQVLGDRQSYTTFDAWTPVGTGGFAMPFESRTYWNGKLVNAQVIANAQLVDAAPDSLLSTPDSVRKKVAALQAGAPGVTIAELTPGVFYLAGGTHHSLAVAQGDSIVLLDAPLGPDRMRPVLDTLRGRFPKQPVRLVVNTHHHWDHVGGIRTVLGAGIPVLTHENNVAFLRRVGAARKTVAPDGVERGASKQVIRGMRDSLTIGGGASQIVLYDLPNPHVVGLVAGYLPAAHILFVADLQQGPPADRRALVEFVHARGLAVERLVGTHGTIMQFADFERSVASR